MNVKKLNKKEFIVFKKMQITEPQETVRLFDENGVDALTYTKSSGKTLHIIANKPSFIKHIFIDNSTNYQKIYKSREIIGKYGPAQPKIWLHDRNLIMPFFKKKMKDYADIVVKKNAARFELWKTFAENGNSIYIDKHITEICIDNLLVALFGELNIDLPSTISLVQEFFRLFQSIESLRDLFPAACGVKCMDEQVYP